MERILVDDDTGYTPWLSEDFSQRCSSAITEALRFTDTETLYAYTPLQGDEIRIMLLMVKGWATDVDDNINCVLINVQPETLPPYACLSYCWGAQEKASPSIYCNRRKFHVSSELFNALECLRANSDHTRLIWIDQLCINQSDPEEKSRQVRRMAEIYHTSRKVLLFPGQNRVFKDAVKFIKAFYSNVERVWKDYEGFKQQWMQKSIHELYHEYRIPLPSDQTWSAVGSLLSAPCFRRTWIVQELMLAKEVRLILEGEEPLFTSREFLGFCLMQSDRNYNSIGKYLQIDDINPPLWLLMTMQAYRASKRDLRFGLLPLLCDTRALGVTDPRDKIYGISSIAMDRELLEIVPNYSASVSDCYVNAARKMIESSGRLDVLLCKETISRKTDLPSWAPNSSRSEVTSFTNGAMTMMRTLVDSLRCSVKLLQ